MDKNPTDLVREMRRMADLHPQTIWAAAMRDGAEMVEKLDSERRDMAAELVSAHCQAQEAYEFARQERQAGYQEGMVGARESALRDDVIRAARAFLTCASGDISSTAHALDRAVRALDAADRAGE